MGVLGQHILVARRGRAQAVSGKLILQCVPGGIRLDID
jgi:hypothetical protein